MMAYSIDDSSVDISYSFFNIDGPIVFVNM